MSTFAMAPVVSMDEDALVDVCISQAGSIVTKRGEDYVSVYVYETTGQRPALIVYSTIAAAEKLRDALLEALPLPDRPGTGLGSIMQTAHDDVTRALGLESLGEGLVSDDTREWLRS
jgi:hypothetical protein